MNGGSPTSRWSSPRVSSSGPWSTCSARLRQRRQDPADVPPGRRPLCLATYCQGAILHLRRTRDHHRIRMGSTATLTVLTGPGPWPAVVLVHGSRPERLRRDDLANKPFKDYDGTGVARHRRVALRQAHDARRAKAMAVKAFTVRQEAIEDAAGGEVAALQLNRSGARLRVDKAPQDAGPADRQQLVNDRSAHQTRPTFRARGCCRKMFAQRR